ncbi:bacteriophage protein [Ameyamaea chiangmaiensis NBRC 103196]|uniref:Phage baseplate assembly protein n=1 Tax=Ameyamaea chiangmaiensis TaxID=442969 RepID=A0A850P7K6_9PROT|nr:phage baseplate assembly protein [Ameyamaea chiangmaiensis]MBS4075475.1 phage baseplate assembly protein [Ameyamaea chiangmaiensis]NVN38993.1 phage baseplate assembly protein [Ameyamaea chiangmaiensis]GBQ69633.1 bacteriophage protein [Ameyamaea chiangmaiensis NBRC 103196]
MNDMFHRLSRRMMMMVGVGRQTAAPLEDDAYPLLQMCLPGDDMLENVLLLQVAGVASRPRVGADHVVALLQGDRTRAVSIASSDQRTRPRDLDDGDVCLVHMVTGSRVWLRSSGDIDLIPSSGTVNVTGDLKVTGTVTAIEVKAGSIALTTHEHSGVEQGQSNTGAPVA